MKYLKAFLKWLTTIKCDLCDKPATHTEPHPIEGGINLCDNHKTSEGAESE